MTKSSTSREVEELVVPSGEPEGTKGNLTLPSGEPEGRKK